MDGLKPWAVTFRVDGASSAALLTGPDAPSDQFNTTFWQSAVLSPDTQHRLVVEVISASTNTPFLLDQIIYIPVNAAPTVTQSFQVFATTTPPQVTVTVSSIPESTGNKGVSTGAIVGGVVAGVTALAIVVVLVYWWYHRRRYGKPYFYGPADPADMLKDEEGSGEWNLSFLIDSSYLLKCLAIPLFDAKMSSDDNHDAGTPRASQGEYNGANDPDAASSSHSHSSSTQSHSEDTHNPSVYPPSLPSSGRSSTFPRQNIPSTAYTITPYKPTLSASSVAASTSDDASLIATKPSSKAVETGLLSPPAAYQEYLGMRATKAS